MVSGDLYVDDFVGDILPYGQEAGDELAAIPYTYTIKEAPTQVGPLTPPQCWAGSSQPSQPHSAWHELAVTI